MIQLRVLYPVTVDYKLYVQTNLKKMSEMKYKRSFQRKSCINRGL